ncbi:hypothetical protein ACMD2_26484, partial [Ananas comosus]
DIVASFRLQKTVAELKENISKLENDIYDEIGVPYSSVAVSSLERIAGSNWTNVVFGIWPYPKNSSILPTWLSILRSSFMSLVVQQSTLHLTTSLFGNASLFEVRKFPGGITIIPPQNAFLLQKPYASFNFSLNFAIYKVQDKVSQLKDQMKLGLFLNSHENLYVKLTNLEGSTVTPPTIVQTAIILAVGNNKPSLPRLKQLAETISNSSSGNLGLNNTVFGRVKQVRLSSYLQHSLNSATSPSPAPQPHHEHHHHHHHHHHHSDQGNKHLAPAPPPTASAPARHYNSLAPPPSGCRFTHPRKPKEKAHHLTPAVAPVTFQHHTAPVASPPRSIAPAAVPQNSRAPVGHRDTPAPAPPFLSASPLPAVVFTHVQPPSESVRSIKPPDGMPAMAPAPFSFYERFSQILSNAFRLKGYHDAAMYSFCFGLVSCSLRCRAAALVSVSEFIVR